MSERLAEARDREEFTIGIRRAAWKRCAGRCEGCGRPLAGIAFTYDHTTPWRRGGASTLENCRVLCNDGRDSCNGRKTFDEDLPGIAALKRYGKGRLPLDIARPAKRPPKIKTRKHGWPSKKLQGRQFTRKP